MNFPTTYLLNVGLHATALSVAACVLLAFLRQPGRRAFVTITGLLSVGMLPWITALRPEPSPQLRPPLADIATPPPALPIFTVAKVPVEAKVKPEMPAVSQPESRPPAPKWTYPDFVNVFLTLWVTGTCLGLVKLAIALVQVTLWKKSLSLPDDAAWLPLHRLVPEAPARRHFRICHRSVSPCVTGFLRPQVAPPFQRHFLPTMACTKKPSMTPATSTAQKPFCM